MKDWMNRPYAFVQYGTVDDARRALEESHDTIVDGRHIRVEQARVNRTLFIAKLPKTMTDSALQSYLEKWGRVECVSLLVNQTTGRSKGCGFAKFRYREDAIRAYLHIRQLGKWAIEWASNIDKQQPERDRLSIFVGQLNPQLVSEDALEKRFQQYGIIESINLVNKNQEAFAFIRFEDEESAQLAIEKENGAKFLDSWIRVQSRETPDTPRVPKQYSLYMPPMCYSSDDIHLLRGQEQNRADFTPFEFEHMQQKPFSHFLGSKMYRYPWQDSRSEFMHRFPDSAESIPSMDSFLSQRSAFSAFDDKNCFYQPRPVSRPLRYGSGSRIVEE